jgi:protein-S-isoprenylcysteine O-methyltransferase Ste14
VAGLAVAMLLAFLVLTLIVRVAIQLRDTGSTGLIGLREGAGALERLAGAVFLLGNLAGASSPALALWDAIEPISTLDTTALHVIGTVIAAAGIVGVFAAQMGMGESWRIGVSDEERTDLITGGLFSICRNPIYTAMIAAWVGFALMVPTVVAFVAVALVAIALEMQVRLVEEPYLVRSHGDAYRDYARRVGRFLPGLGRLG